MTSKKICTLTTEYVLTDRKRVLKYERNSVPFIHTNGKKWREVVIKFVKTVKIWYNCYR